MQLVHYHQLNPGDYFRSIYTDALFVKKSDHAQAVLINGLADTHDYTLFDDHMPVNLLDFESEWPVIDYKPEIRKWGWPMIKVRAKANVFLSKDDELHESAWIGTTIGVMPSGKVYTFWTSNQTVEDVNRDRHFSEALEAVFNEHGMFTSWNESGDLLACRQTSFEEVAKAAGYRIEENGPLFSWHHDESGEECEQYYNDEDEAWKACCIENKLVQS
jgi:hypothetical protein